MRLAAARVASLAEHNARLMARDPWPIVVLFGIPVVVMAFLTPAFRVVLRDGGVAGASGAEQTVPGMAAMFAFFWVGLLGYYLFAEYRWSTWERIVASPARPLELVLGKTIPWYLAAVAHIGLLLVLGAALFELRVRGPVALLVPLACSLALFVVALTVALFSVCRSSEEAGMVGNLAGVAFAGIGGALAPLSLLPGWVEDVAPYTPTYWALRGLRAVILDEDATSVALESTAVLLGLSVLLLALASLRLRRSRPVLPR